MKLKFNSDAFYNGKLIAAKGEIKEISEENGFASRWIKRGAEEVKEEVPKVEDKEQVLEDIKEMLDGSKEEDEEEAMEVVDFDAMKKEELLKYIAYRGISLPNDIKKVADIREFLKNLD